VRPHRQPEADGAGHRFAVHHRQRAGQRQIDGASLGVGFGAEGGGRAAEDFAARGQLRVGLEADHDFVALDKQLLGHAGNSTVSSAWRYAATLADAVAKAIDVRHVQSGVLIAEYQDAQLDQGIP